MFSPCNNSFEIFKQLDRANRLNVFSLKQIQNAMNPDNFFLTNTLAKELMISTNGRSIVNGVNNFQQDLINSSLDYWSLNRKNSEFVIGKNIARTPCSVIYKTELLEVLSYKTTDSHEIPILIVPSTINKYYMLDLSEENSLIKYLVDQNFQVFTISFNNLDHPKFSFQDCLNEIEQVIKFLVDELGYPKLNLFGYCMGGTFISILMDKLESYINSMSFVNSGLNYDDIGEFDLFINNQTLPLIEEYANKYGFIKGQLVGQMFNMIKSKDAVWKYYQNNYLYGNDPMKSDIMYWNDDSVNQSIENLMFFIREIYLGNKLAKNSLVIENQIITLKSRLPKFFIGCIHDHIITPQCILDSGLLLDNATICLSTGGHVNGIVNPPYRNKGKHWIISNPNQAISSIINSKDYNFGSWWTSWVNWLKDFSGAISTEDNSKINLYKIQDDCGEYVKIQL